MRHNIVLCLKATHKNRRWFKMSYYETEDFETVCYGFATIVMCAMFSEFSQEKINHFVRVLIFQ